MLTTPAQVVIDLVFTQYRKPSVQLKYDLELNYGYLYLLFLIIKKEMSIYHNIWSIIEKGKKKKNVFLKFST